ncbi:MAG: hypothetical protein J7500_05865 [Sphingomonas sp.]|uniref:hypothetical protein n=1 Tax=Sphingomonas sp. TaxID=28214 RepID=UPI001B14937E|nr:hypothetical protein [Sphingomonas sp.]MBO9622221.1 hypothetical protein [Sphingomonas sp.]
MRPDTQGKSRKRWHRKRGDYIVKTAKLTDGELLQLMLKPNPQNREALDERYYQSFREIRESSKKAFLWILGAAAFGILSHFGVVKSARASGLEVLPAVFSHTALLALSFSSTAFCFSYSKQTFIQVWFLAKLRNAGPEQKADSLLRYPEAYWIFHFLPAAIGYPKHIRGPRIGWGQLVYVILLIIAIAIFAVGSLWLWLAVASDVWRSAYQNHTVSVLVITLAGAVTLLGWASPFYYDWPRKYQHIGLVNSLAKLEGAELRAAHMRIFHAAARMDLIDPDLSKTD